MAERAWTTSDFEYLLPEDQIAQVPSHERGASRLLTLERRSGAVADLHFSDLTVMIAPGDLLVVNSTRVRHARLPGTRPSGGPAEVLLIHPLGNGSWLAMGRPGSAMKPGRVIDLGDGIGVETIAVRDDGMREVRIVGGDVETAIARFGRLPLPPYITRDPTDEDDRRYQTIYAEREGSVAAPTAGLHITEGFLAELRENGVVVVDLDLEVGPGTFKPVETEQITDHPMHAESFEIPVATAEAIAALRSRGGALWAVGTTVVRALESVARSDGTVPAGAATTSLLISPGFRFQAVDRLITNFHLPRSTLLMLVSAFAGHGATMAAYRHAVSTGYRFYSYGDAMCIL
jgi:S-adenosylmethionine:tRNA ribosyltransferase-isomerase